VDGAEIMGVTFRSRAEAIAYAENVVRWFPLGLLSYQDARRKKGKKEKQA
jgi:hypothetical protein